MKGDLSRLKVLEMGQSAGTALNANEGRSKPMNSEQLIFIPVSTQQIFELFSFSLLLPNSPGVRARLLAAV